MKIGVQNVKLGLAILVSAMSCWFVAQYRSSSPPVSGFDHPVIGGFNEILRRYGWVYYVWPAVTLILGLWLQRVKPSAKMAFNAVIGTTWVLAIAFTFACFMCAASSVKFGL